MRELGYDEELRRFNLSLYAAQKVKGSSIENCKINVSGMTGTGKSVLSMSGAYCTAEEMSMMDHKGDPGYAEEYFPYWEAMGIILPEEHLRVIKMEGVQVKVLEELQEGANSRDSYTMQNRLINTAFTLRRPSREVYWANLQFIKMQDSQSRMLYHIYVETLPMNAFQYGVNFCKIKIGHLRALDRNDPIHYYYPIVNGIQYPVAAVLLPPRKVLDFYDKKRAENLKILSDRKEDEMNRQREVDRIKQDAVLYGRQNKENAIKKLLEDNASLSGSELAKKVDCSESYARDVKRRLGYGKKEKPAAADAE